MSTVISEEALEVLKKDAAHFVQRKTVRESALELFKGASELDKPQAATELLTAIATRYKGVHLVRFAKQMVQDSSEEVKVAVAASCVESFKSFRRFEHAQDLAFVLENEKILTSDQLNELKKEILNKETMMTNPSNPIAECSAKLSTYQGVINNFDKLPVETIGKMINVLGNVASYYHSIDPLGAQVRKLALTTFEKADDELKMGFANIILRKMSERCDGDMSDLAVSFVKQSPESEKSGVATSSSIAMLQFGHLRFEGFLQSKLKDVLTEEQYLDFIKTRNDAVNAMPELSLDSALDEVYAELNN